MCADYRDVFVGAGADRHTTTGANAYIHGEPFFPSRGTTGMPIAERARGRTGFWRRKNNPPLGTDADQVKRPSSSSLQRNRRAMTVELGLSGLEPVTEISLG